MKKLFCFLAVATTALFTSCSNDDDSGSDSTGGTTITLTPSAETITLDQSVTFTLKDQDENELTGYVLTTNGAVIDDPWTPEAVGTYTITATYEGITDTATVTVEQNENTFMIDGVEYDTNQNLLIYVGTIGEAGNNYWALSSAKVDEEGQEPGVVNFTTVIFTTEQVGEELEFPSTGQTLTLVNDPDLIGTQGGAIIFDTDNETDPESITGLDLIINTLNLSDNPEEQTINYDFSMELEQTLTINGTFSGILEYVNGAGRPGRNTASRQPVASSKAEIMQKIKEITKRQ